MDGKSIRLLVIFRYDYKETIIANKRQRIDNFAMKTYYCQLYLIYIYIYIG